jgi:hypothetical protein
MFPVWKLEQSMWKTWCLSPLLFVLCQAPCWVQRFLEILWFRISLTLVEHSEMLLRILLVLALSCPCFFVTVSLGAPWSRIICPGLYNAGQVRLSTNKLLVFWSGKSEVMCIVLCEGMRVCNILLSYNLKLSEYKYLMLIFCLAPSSQIPLVCVVLCLLLFTVLNSRGDDKWFSLNLIL